MLTLLRYPKNRRERRAVASFRRRIDRDNRTAFRVFGSPRYDSARRHISRLWKAAFSQGLAVAARPS